jgi:hypothetical protein
MASLFIEKGACSMGDLVAKGFSLEEIALFWGVAEGLFGAKLARCFDDPGRTD